jgi:hypothetical protein
LKAHNATKQEAIPVDLIVVNSRYGIYDLFATRSLTEYGHPALSLKAPAFSNLRGPTVMSLPRKELFECAQRAVFGRASASPSTDNLQWNVA